MAATVQSHELNGAEGGTDKTSGTIRFKLTDNATVDLVDPLSVPGSGTSYSMSSSRNGVGLRVGLLGRFSAAVTRRARLIVAYSIDFVLVFPPCGQTPGVMRRAPGRA